MSWLISAKQYIPAVIGQAWGGGYFAGYISHTANGVPTHALIVAPRATGATGTGYPVTTGREWKLTNTATFGTGSSFDGAANTAAMVAAGIDDHPAAKFCVNLSIGGFTDWYLPARYEYDIAYSNLKPTTSANSTSQGANLYAVPQRNGSWSFTSPAQTNLVQFQSGGAEAFSAIDNHRSSTETSSINAGVFQFTDGSYTAFFGKNAARPVRAFRRIAL